MKILNYSAGADTGGQAIRLHRAFTNHSTHEYRSIVSATNYLQYPKDLAWSARAQAVRAADVIHVNNNFRTTERISKPMVIHYHGSSFRKNPEAFLAQQRQRGVQGTASTLDLWLLAPDELTWLPAPYDLDWLASFVKPHDGPLRIGHAPTDRPVKSTAPFLAAFAKLKKTHDVDLVLIERTRWATCLERKGSVDVFFDQVQLGFGNNALEAWGMGIPVIAGGQPDTLAEMRNRFGELPFYQATEASIYEALQTLTDEITRKEWGERGLAYVRRFHAEPRVVELLGPIYEAAISAGPARTLSTAGSVRGRAGARHRRRI